MIERDGKIPCGSECFSLSGTKEKGGQLKTKDGHVRGFQGLRKTTRKCNLALAEDTQGREVKELCRIWYKRTMTSAV